MIVRCDNPQCLNYAIEIDVGERPVDPETGEPFESWAVVCGPCGATLSAADTLDGDPATEGDSVTEDETVTEGAEDVGDRT